MGHVEALNRAKALVLADKLPRVLWVDRASTNAWGENNWSVASVGETRPGEIYATLEYQEHAPGKVMLFYAKGQ